MPATNHLPHLEFRELLDANAEHGFDAAFGAARRDRERARVRERIVSFRDEFGQWEPQRERSQVCSLYNGRTRGEHARVFPISNWTELDVWQCIAEEALEVPSTYFAPDREVYTREGMPDAASPFGEPVDGEQPSSATARYRTVGDMSATGAVESSARTIEEVVADLATERGQTRGEDTVTDAAMEDRKRQGYF